jgi:predicted metal-dependent phosphoesterase TrpH
LSGATVWDLHVHTTAGSADASLRAAAIGAAARAAGVEGVLVAEHFRRWDDAEARAVSERDGVLVLPAREWTTPLGHILAIGLRREDSELRDPALLRRAADGEGALLVAAHPFRHFFDAPRQGLHRATLRTDDPAEAARLELFSYVDAIEAANGNCTPRENHFAAAVALVLDKPTTAGSDAHYAEEIGRQRTLFAQPVSDLAALIAALRAGECTPVCAEAGDDTQR